MSISFKYEFKNKKSNFILLYKKNQRINRQSQQKTALRYNKDKKKTKIKHNKQKSKQIKTTKTISIINIQYKKTILVLKYLFTF